MAAFIIWGFVPLPLRALSGYPSGQILFFRILVSAGLLLVLLISAKRREAVETVTRFRNGEVKEKRNLVLFTAAGGMLLPLNWLLYIYVINNVSIQTASFAYLLCPILTAVLGFLLLKEKLNRNQWLAIGLSVISCCLIGIGQVTNLLFSILIAGSYALYLITQKVLKDYDKIVLLAMQLLLAILLIGPFYSYFQGEGEALPGLHFFGFILILSAVFTVLPLFLNLYGLKELSSGTIGILMYLNPIINFLLAFLYYKEEATLQQGLAYALIFVSVILYNLKIRKAGALPSSSGNSEICCY
ncbi:EamA family transporter [Adhaeribacter soli]|uniref:EamA family transporter n=2 Tax=Adhaeribacter soli TaxID=2607655 RepID=A0A5N1IK44_9BACT|nr:EamA family transporter [Adhaeribacter soli]